MTYSIYLSIFLPLSLQINAPCSELLEKLFED